MSINRQSVEMTEGETVQLAASVIPIDATDQVIGWWSENSSVAAVAGGVVTAMAPGVTNIFVRTNDGGYTATCQVTVKAKYIQVTGVSLSQSTLSLKPGGTFNLTASVIPSNATNKDVSWSSSNTSVATVASDGTVTAIAPGTATITVTTADQGKTATCFVTVNAIPASSITLSNTTLSLTEGDNSQLSATVAPDNATNKAVSWSSSDTSVAIVADDGTVTAKSAGTATITCSSANGAVKATCSVTVKAKVYPVTGVSLSQTTMTLTEGQTSQLTATVSPSNATNKNVAWSSSNTSVATVSSNGTVTAKSAGTAIITVKTSDQGKTATCSVTVKAKVYPVTGVSLSQTTMTLTEGESSQLTATVSPSNATNKNVAWSSSNTSVATVSSNGTVTAKSAGTAIITVKTDDQGKTATCSVTVKAKVIEVASITLSQSTVSLKEEESLRLTATIEPSNATNKGVTWSSDNTGIATVDSEGIIMAVTEGTVTITAKSADGKVSATCKVTVTAEYVDFPDPNFRKYMVDNFDLNGNGKISLTEAKKITSIKVSTVDIESVEGIEYLDNLERLDVSNPLGDRISSGRKPDGAYYGVWSLPVGKLTSLDLSHNPDLTYLNCGYNQIGHLNISKNYLLKELRCYLNPLYSIDLSNNSQLIFLECSSNQLTSLDISNNTDLVSLYCHCNQLTSIDVSNNVKLELLYFAVNNISSIDICNNPALTSLYCNSNQLTSLDVSKNTALTELYCENNQLTTLDVSKNTALKDLFCYSNQLTTLDVSKNKSLTSLDCSPMSTLKTLYVSSGQSIEGVTVNRSTDRVPSGTSIKTK